jgi:hexosaminidase
LPWDYYSQDKSIYDRNIEKHLKFKNEIIFAGGEWKWMGFAPCNHFSFKTSWMALESCREHGVKSVIATGWSDDGAECSSFSTLPVLQLFAEDCYEADTSDAHIAKRLYTCAGANMSDFMNLDMPNLIKGNEAPGGSSINPSKYLLFQDVLCGLFEKHTEIGAYNSFYKNIAKQADEIAYRNPEWAYIFKTSAALNRVLEIKCDIGLRLREAYRKKDNEQLRSLSDNELAELLARVEIMHETFRVQWNKENKIFGFDVQDIRFGALKERIKSAIKRIDSYLSNEIEKIEEFEVEPLDFWCRTDENATPHISVNVWQDIVTANIL